MNVINILRDIKMPDNVFDMKDLIINIESEISIISLKLDRIHQMRQDGKLVDGDDLHRTMAAHDIKIMQVKKINVEISRLKESKHKEFLESSAIKRDQKRFEKKVAHIASLEKELSAIRTAMKDILGFDKYLEIVRAADPLYK